MDDNRTITQKLFDLPKPPPRRPQRVGPPLEKTIQANVEKALNLMKGVFVERHSVGAIRSARGHYVRFGKPGQGDLGGWVMILGLAIVLEVEVKRPGGSWKQTPLQLKRQQRIEADGGCYLLVTSATQAIAGVEAFRAATIEKLRAAFAAPADPWAQP